MEKKYNKIEEFISKDYSKLMVIWESSVRATHNFLLEEDFLYYKKKLPIDYFPNIKLYTISSNENIFGFLGASEDNIEMLFISDLYRGNGHGKRLLDFATNELHLKKVDVNEQNFLAVNFYKNFGFKIIKRSLQDNEGKRYPILHMKL